MKRLLRCNSVSHALDYITRLSGFGLRKCFNPFVSRAAQQSAQKKVGCLKDAEGALYRRVVAPFLSVDIERIRDLWLCISYTALSVTLCNTLVPKMLQSWWKTIRSATFVRLRVIGAPRLFIANGATWLSFPLPRGAGNRCMQVRRPLPQHYIDCLKEENFLQRFKRHVLRVVFRASGTEIGRISSDLRLRKLSIYWGRYGDSVRRLVTEYYAEKYLRSGSVRFLE